MACEDGDRAGERRVIGSSCRVSRDGVTDGRVGVAEIGKADRKLTRVGRFTCGRIIGGNGDFGRVVVGDGDGGRVTQRVDRDIRVTAGDARERQRDRFVVFEQAVIEHGNIDCSGGAASQDRDRTRQWGEVGTARRIATHRIGDNRIGVADLR